MRNALTIAKYELKMQMKNWAPWMVVLLTSFLAIYEQFPSEENLRRISGLIDHNYIAARSMSLTGMLLMFGYANVWSLDFF